MPSSANIPASHALQKSDSTFDPMFIPPSKKSFSESSCPPGHFDLTLLRPLPIPLSNNTNHKYIELYCKGRKENLCCFKGHQNAAIVLSLEKHQIEQMCTKEKGAPVFHSFELSYAPNRHHSSSYYFGGHSEDYRPFLETYFERLERFRNTYETEMKRWEEINPTTNEINLSILPEFQSKTYSGVEKIMVTSVKREDHLLNNQNKYQLLCIICQDTRARIIFEPCKHAVLCEACFSKGFCRKFCPICRTPLLSTTKPNKIRIVRPRVFSTYSVLDDSS